MKKLLFLFALALSLSSSAQTTYSPWSNATEYYSQMWTKTINTRGAYFDAGLPLGSQKDTSCAGCRQDPLYLTTAKFYYNAPPKKDSVIPAPIYGGGNILITYQTYRTGRSASDTPKVVATLYQSSDAYTWDIVTGTAAQTTRPFTALPKSGYFSVAKTSLMYAVRFDVTVDTAMCQSQVYFLKSNYVTIPAK